MVELLESRIAPAPVLLPNGITLNGNTASWTDYDGDHVKMTWTGNPLNRFLHEQTVAPVFQTIVPADAVPGGILVTEITFANANDNITVKVTDNPLRRMGNGRVDLGYINAAGIPLDSFIAPQATVLEFDCGASTIGHVTNAIGTLDIAGYGTSSPENFTSNLDPAGPVGTDGIGALNGNVGTVEISGNIEYGTLEVGTIHGSTVGTIKIGGSLKGDGNTGTNSGVLEALGKVGTISIGKGIIGSSSTGQENGELLLEGAVGRITIGGDIVGGTTEASGSIDIAGDGIPTSASIITIKGSLIGGAGLNSGHIYLPFAGTLSIAGSVIGGSSDGTGEINLGSGDIVSIGGSLIGGAVNTASTDLGTGIIMSSGDLHTITIGHNIQAGSIAGGGTVKYSGAIGVGGNLVSLTVDGDILGSNTQRVYILAEGDVPAAGGAFNAIGKIVIHGTTSYGIVESGQEFGPTIGAAEQPDAGIGSVTIGGDYIHSSLMAGINDNPSSGGFPDGVDPNDTDSGLGILGPVKIYGAVLDDPSAGGYSGFEAHSITSIDAAGVVRFLHNGTIPILDPDGFVLVREI